MESRHREIFLRCVEKPRFYLRLFRIYLTYFRRVEMSRIEGPSLVYGFDFSIRICVQYMVSLYGYIYTRDRNFVGFLGYNLGERIEIIRTGNF